ncbi:MAG: ATP-binding cassette domain-containing protein [Holosporaceae bacterium]|jgi:putative ABC transport system ATP-binding protein|nr:ATP-binding cassette domain-containing protein [Holosporaceae bacterium]
MIRVEDLFIVFFPGSALERIALRGINFAIQKGEVVSILGNNGSGRTTLLKFIAGHIQANFGRLWVDKVDVTSQKLSERSKIFSPIFYDHNTGTAGNLTIAENLAIATMHHQSKSIIEPAISPETREMFIQQLHDLDFMGMEELIDEKVCNLSRPYRQVLAMLIAVIKGVKVLLIDEHSTGLDKESSIALLETTEKIIKSQKITTIMAINDPKFALEVADKVIVLSHGQIVLDISGEEKKNTSVESLFTSYNIIPPLKEMQK